MQPNEIVAGAEYAVGDAVRRVLSIADRDTVYVKQMPDGSLKKPTAANLKKWETLSGEIRAARLYGKDKTVTAIQKDLGFLSIKRQHVGGTVAYREDGSDSAMPIDEFAKAAERRVR